MLQPTKKVSLGITIMIQSFNICSLERRIALFYYQKESKKLSFTNDHGKTDLKEKKYSRIERKKLSCLWPVHDQAPILDSNWHSLLPING